MKKVLSVLLVVMLVLTVIPLSAFEFSVSAATEITESTFNSKYQKFKSDKYPDGSIYKNDPSSTGGYECFGYANEIAMYIFGGKYITNYGAATNNVNANWSIIRGEKAIDNLHIGDVVRYRASDAYDHSIFVYKISGNTVYYTDANGGSTYNKVASRTTTKAELKTKIKKALKSDSSVVGYIAHYKYWVTTPVVYNLTVRYNANGGRITNSTYYTNDSDMIYRSASSAYHTNTLQCGTSYPNGFVNASTLGLVRDGYIFLGWSKTKTATKIYDEDEGFKPEDIVSEVKTSNQTITMYARWEEVVTINSIEILNLPKTTYYLGEALDTAGMQLLLKNSDNTQTVVMEGFTISGYDSTKIGTQRLTVTYDNKTTYFDVVVLKNYTPGDIDNDEEINLKDLIKIAQYIAKWSNNEINEAAIDVNGDSIIDLNDVNHLARYLAGWDVALN